MTRIALLIEYDGAKYNGWQAQKENVPTIQGQIEKSLSYFANHPVTIVTAGRTDAGVHALNQVAHFETTANRQITGWIKGVNANLSDDIRIKKAVEVGDQFDARFSAISRTYHYYLYNDIYQPAILFSKVGVFHYPLDINLMQEAAKHLLGKKDFSAFRASACQANSPIRNMSAVEVEQRDNLIRFSFTANAFLYHMVRNLVGALIYVGNNKLSVEEFAELITEKNRIKSPPTFMASGLYLVDINYTERVFPAISDKWLFQI